MAGLCVLPVQQSPSKAQEGQRARRKSLHLSTPSRLALAAPERPRSINCAVQDVSFVLTGVRPSYPARYYPFPVSIDLLQEMEGDNLMGRR